MAELRCCPNGHPIPDDMTSMSDTVECPVCGTPTLATAGGPVDVESSGPFDELPFVPKRISSSSVTSDFDTLAESPIALEWFAERAESSGLLSHDALASFVSECPEDRRPTDGRELANQLVQSGQLTRFQADELCKPAPEPLRLGEFTITDRIGRGGMGDVFRATHASMGRVVALKVLPPEVSTRSSAVERFEREAAAAAQLEHDHIVTVYEVGHDKGRHYFTMQFVDGPGLSGLLRDGPIDGRHAAAYLEPVARAVAAAHQHGILHRDLKPHNILIDRESDRPLVADFGLARLTDDDGELTLSGTVLGTPQYMPPEQARDATRTTTASDVYSLGATLYHAITGRPPFQAAGSMETLRQVLTEQPVAPRNLNVGIDRDLETICLKCLEKEPPSRYASATELADELDRYLNSRPIAARPIGVSGRAWRWCRRNPAVASLTVAACVGFLAAFVATGIGLITFRSEYRRAERGFEQARQVVHDFLTRVSDETLLNQPGMQSLKHDLLAKALAYYAGFLAERGDDPAIQQEIASIHFRVGLIIEQIRSADESLDSFHAARRLQEELLARTPSDFEIRSDLASTCNAEARVLFRLKRTDEAVQAYESALEFRRDLADERPDETEAWRLLANTYMNLGILHKSIGTTQNDTGRLVLARDRMMQAQSIRADLIARSADAAVLRDSGLGQYNLGELTLLMNDLEAAGGHFASARDVFTRLLADQPNDLDGRYRLVVSTRLLGDLEESDLDAADRYYAEAREQAESLTLRNPDVHEYRQELARVLLVYGELQLDLEQPENARQSLKAAIQQFTRLHDGTPSSAYALRGLGMACLTLGSLDLEANPAEAARHLSDARDRLARYLDHAPQDEDARAALEEAESLLAQP